MFSLGGKEGDRVIARGKDECYEHFIFNRFVGMVLVRRDIMGYYWARCLWVGCFIRHGGEAVGGWHSPQKTISLLCSLIEYK